MDPQRPAVRNSTHVANPTYDCIICSRIGLAFITDYLFRFAHCCHSVCYLPRGFDAWAKVGDGMKGQGPS
jgi:hypothetical protein